MPTTATRWRYCLLMSLQAAPQPLTVVFDLGKVLLDFDYRIASARLAPRASVPPDEILRLLLGTPLLHRYECGELSTPEFFEILGREAGLTVSFDEFAQWFTDIFTPIPAMIQFHHRLCAAGWPTVLLSNTNELQFEHIRKAHPFVAEFDHQVLSFEHRAMKPDPTLYRVVESLTGLRGPQLVFLDDRADNVAAAQALGWRAFVHQTPEQSQQAFARLGLWPSHG
jgi:glucose-1-phosphatase